MKTTFKEWLIIAVIIIISILGFFMFRKAYSVAKYDYAVIYYGKDEVAIVNFRDQKILLYDQEDTLDGEIKYPILNEEEQTITLLGSAQGINKVRYEVVIKYNFKKRSMQIVDERSPNKICTKDGEKNSGSIQCLPNRVSVVFKNFDKEDEFDGEI